MIPISACIITKNESANLDKCLAALASYPFEIVVVDTGSTDNSKEIARKYTNKVYDFTWVDDFSAARNYAAGRASHNMIFPVDTDEFVTRLDWEELQALIEQHPKSVGSIKRLDYFETDGEKRCQICMIDRIYHRNYYHYEQPIHEVLAPLDRMPYASYHTSVEMDHIGYLGPGNKLKDKALRDMELLLKELEQNPEEPYYYFQIGQSYMLMRDPENSLLYFQKAMDCHPDPRADYTHVLIYNYGHLLLERGLLTQAAVLLEYYCYYNDNMDYLCLIGLYYLHLNQPLKALPEFVKALTAPVRDMTDQREPSYYIGYIYELFGKKDIARTHYLNCGADYTPAAEGLARLSSFTDMIKGEQT